jgi:hypothetical protein
MGRFHQQGRAMNIRKILIGSSIVVAFAGIMLGSMYAVGSDLGTTFKPGPHRAEYRPLSDTSQAFQQLGGAPNSGAFGMPFAAKASLHNFVRVYGHQPYTNPTDPFDQ